jgi:acyl carrier protein
MRNVWRDWAESQPEVAKAWGATHYPGLMQQVAMDFVLILSEQIGVPVRQFKPTDRFIEDLQIVGLDTVEVVMAVEEHFNLQLPDEAAEQLVTIHDFICYLQQRVHEAKPE